MAFGLIESYNRTRYVEELLEKVDGQSPSFTVHLHPEYWVLNNGSKFLYHNQIASLLDDIRAHRIPVDFLELFDSAHVPFYEGCMVVELLDYRAQKFNQPQPEKPERTRVILHPNPETLYADICTMNQKSGGTWTDRDAVEVESRLILATTPPLCLDPNPHLTRVANHVLRASTPTIPMSLKRKAAAVEHEEDESEKFRKRRIMSYGAPSDENRKPTPSYAILDTLYTFRKEKEAEAQNPLPTHPYLLGPPPRPPLATTSPSPAQVLKKDPSAPPQPAQPSLQFVSQQPPPTAAVANPAMQPRVYANVQAATEAATAAATNGAQTPQTTQTLQHQHQQHQYQLQLLHKAQQQQQQTMQASPKVPSVLPQPAQNEQPRPTPTPKPSVAPGPIQRTATSSGGPYPNQQFLMQVSQQPSQQPQQGAPAVQRSHTPQQIPSDQVLAHIQAEAAKAAENLKVDPNNEALKAQFARAVNQYNAYAKMRGPTASGAGRATPQNSVVNGQPSHATATSNVPQHAGQQQQQNGQPQHHQAAPLTAQHYPQQSAQPVQNPQQPQQLGTGQFTFAAGFPQRSVVTPSQAHMVAVAQANQAKANAGTPAPGGVPVQHSPQHQPPSQQQQLQQQQLQQQHLQQQQQLQTPQMQHQQLRTPQMQQQQLRGTPQMQPQQIRTPQVQPQQLRTPQMQQQQLQVPQQQHTQMQRQSTPQVSLQQQQHLRQMAQAHAQAQPQQQQQALALQQARIAQLHQQQQLHAVQAAQAQQRSGQPIAQHQQQQQQQQQQMMSQQYIVQYQRAVAEGKIPPGMTPAQLQHYQQQWIMASQRGIPAGQQQHPNAVQAQALAVAAQAQAANAANGGGGNPMVMQGNMQAMQTHPSLMAAMRHQQQQQILDMQRQNQQRQQ